MPIDKKTFIKKDKKELKRKKASKKERREGTKNNNYPSWSKKQPELNFEPASEKTNAPCLKS